MAVNSHLLPTYARVDLAFERGEGVWLVTADGERYLDFTSGVAVNALGHAHPALVAALTEQAHKVWHVSNLYRIPEGERLAERLCEATFADTVFFQNSGAEAIECAIKMARKYQSASGKPERYRIITFEGAFHGRTLAADRRHRQQEISGRLRPAGRRLRPGAVRRSRRGQEGDRSGDRRDPDRADPGRGRRARAAAEFPARAARAVRPARPAADLRRDADRLCAHRRPVRLSARRRHARHHGGRQGARRRLSGGRLSRHRRSLQGHDRRHARLDLRRQSARHGGRQCRARRDAGARLPRARARRRAAAQAAAGRDQGPPRLGRSPRCAARAC